MEKYFDINDSGCSIHCKLFAANPRSVDTLVICAHGFAGSKEGSSIRRLADKLSDLRKDAGLLAFDWPCHGEDRSPRLTLEVCDLYLTTVIRWAEKTWSPQAIYGYANSFGGYLFLKYLSEHPSPFRKTVLRCPALPMHEVIRPLISPDDAEKLRKGREVPIGFDRKVRVTQSFLDELAAGDVTKRDLTAHMDDILILHGTADEIVPFAGVSAFADENLIECVPFEGCDHRFQRITDIGNAIARTLDFFYREDRWFAADPGGWSFPK